MDMGVASEAKFAKKAENLILSIMIQYDIVSHSTKDVNRFFGPKKFFSEIFQKTMRIDKFLKVSRILKRRTVAHDAAEGEKISVNGKEVKPSYRLKIGDVVEVAFVSGTLKFRVLDLKEFVKKDEAAGLYEVIV